MEFRILGPLEVWDGGGEVSLGGPKPRALLVEVGSSYSPAASAVRLRGQRIRPAQPREATEVRVGRVERCVVLECERGEVSVRCQVAGSAERLEKLPEQDGVSWARMEHRRAGRAEPGVHNVERFVDAERRLEDPRVRNQPNECDQRCPIEAERLDTREARLEP
jgi:hypothetical protein